MDESILRTISEKYYNNNIRIIFYFCDLFNLKNDKTLEYGEIYAELYDHIHNYLFSKKRFIIRPVNVIKDEIYEIMFHYHKIKNSIIKVQQLWRFKHYKKYDNHCTLELESLDKFAENEKFHFIQNRTIYTFTIYDMIRCIKSCIENVNYIHSEPLFPRNPYTNQEFCLTTMYNLFVKIKENNIKCDSIVDSFYECNFNIQKYKYKNYIYLREHAINEYISNSSLNNLLHELNDCLLHVTYQLRLSEMIYYRRNRQNIFINIKSLSEKAKNKIINVSKSLIKQYIFMKVFSENEIQDYHIDKFIDMFKMLQYNIPRFWENKLHIRK